jgi:hypothetical protein
MVWQRGWSNEFDPIVTSVEEEIGACRESRKHTLDVVTNILEQLKAGQNIKLGSVRQAVNRMVSSVVRNPDAFFWLSRLKDKDNYAYMHCVDTSI